MTVQLLSDEAYICTGVYLTVLGILAVIGNSFVLIVIIKGRPNFIKIHTVLMSVVAVSDLTVSVTAYPLTAVSGYHKKWYFNEMTCKMTGFVVYFFTMCTINSLCVMAISRYVIVCRPDLDRFLRGKYIVFWLIGIFLYALLWTGSPLIGWSSYGPEPFQTSCTVNWYGKSVADITYNSLCIIFCYCVPVAIFIFCYYNVLKNSLRRNGTGISPTAGQSSTDTVVDEMAKYAKKRASRHMTYICVAMMMSFIIIWTPYALMTFWNLVSTPASSSVQVLPTMFAKLNCITNPIIYSLFSDRFREAASKSFPCNNKVSPDRQGEQQVEHVLAGHVHDEDSSTAVSVANALWFSAPNRFMNGQNVFDITVMMLEERVNNPPQSQHVHIEILDGVEEPKSPRAQARLDENTSRISEITTSEI